MSKPIRCGLTAIGAVMALAACASLVGAPAVAAPPSSEAVSAETMALHRSLLTLDTHLDTPALLDGPRGYDMLKRHDVLRDGSEVDLPRMKAGGLDGGFFVVFMPQGPLTPEGYSRVRDQALLRALSIRMMVAAHPKEFELAPTSADAARINAAGKTFAYMSIENSYEIGEDISLIDTFYKLGVRLIGPVHNGTNQLADSANPGAVGAKWGGLSPLGKAFVKRANELGMVLDGSHSSDQAIDQMIDLSAVPIILSHHGVKALNDHPRNSPDDLIKKLAAKGGVIQMNSLFLKTLPPPSPERTAALAKLRTDFGNPDTLPLAQYERYLDARAAIEKQFPTPLATFDDYMAQVLYALKLVGPEHVGFGADWDGGGGVAGLRDVSQLPRITERLLKAGYSKADLANMWGGNVLRVMKAAEDYAASARK